MIAWKPQFLFQRTSTRVSCWSSSVFPDSRRRTITAPNRDIKKQLNGTQPTKEKKKGNKCGCQDRSNTPVQEFGHNPRRDAGILETIEAAKPEKEEGEKRKRIEKGKWLYIKKRDKDHGNGGSREMSPGNQINERRGRGVGFRGITV